MSREAFLRREIDLGSFPGASWAVGTAEGIEEENALGHAVTVPFRLAATTATLYDCASITKPLVTGILVLQLLAEGRIALDDCYRGYTYRELLTHTTGLRAWLPTYWYESPLLAIEKYGPEGPRGEAVYSDLNFILLYYALSELLGDYVTAASERVFEPLGLREAMFHPPASLKSRIAATEWGQRFEPVLAQKSGSPAATHPRPLRQGLMWGEVNDGNSFYGGGTLGNAGLFATATGVFRIAQGFVQGRLVPFELVHEATRAHAGDRGFGWQVGGPGLSPLSFGHNGFTGTSVWVDEGRIFVLLTNRVHPCAAATSMQRAREEFHRGHGRQWLF